MKTIITLGIAAILLLSIVVGGVFLSQNYTITKKVDQDIFPTPTPEIVTHAKAPEQIIDIPLYHLGFTIPADMKITNQDPNQYVSSNTEITAISKDAVNSGSDHFKKGVIVNYSLIQPWRPNIYNIPFGTAFNGEGKTIQLDSTKLTNNNPLLHPDQITIYTYLIGDDDGHNRGKFGMAYQGDVRLDFKTTDNIVANEAVYFKCTDSTATTTSKSCETALNTFLSSLHLESATAMASPVSFSSKQYFSDEGFKKRHFSPDDQQLVFDDFSATGTAFPSFASQDAELTNLTDDQLQVMSCMPQQLYLDQSGYPHYSELPNNILLGDQYIETIRTTDGSNLFHEVKVGDPELRMLISNMSKLSYTGLPSLISHFIACKTDNNTFILKYNTQNSADKNKIISSIATISPDGKFQNIADITLPNLSTYCENPLALTKDNIFYLGCHATESNGMSTTNSQYIYKIDLANHTEKMLSTCSNDYENDSKQVTSTCN
jgi:hypothetical protein